MRIVTFEFIVKDENEERSLHNDLYGYLQSYDVVNEQSREATKGEILGWEAQQLERT